MHEGARGTEEKVCATEGAAVPGGRPAAPSAGRRAPGTGPAAEKIVEARDVRHAYVLGREDLLGVSLDVIRGEFVAVVGENGSGKTTFARHLDALLALQAGELTVCSFDASDPTTVWELRRACGMVFQSPENQFVSTEVAEDVAFGPRNFGASEEEAASAASAALATVGLAGFEQRSVYELSGGQQQRVALAGVLACDPDLIVLDEATSMIDPHGRDELSAAVRAAQALRGATVIWITHDMELAARADRVVVMRAGRVAAQGAPEEILANRELLERAGLEPPFVVRCWEELVRLGRAAGPAPVTVEGLVSALCG